MTSSELHRKLLYRGYDDITDYTKNSPVNRYMLKLVQDLCRANYVDVDVLTLFNEIYYQCVRIQYDGNPGINIYKRYIDEAAEWLHSRSAAELVFCMVWALYQRKIDIQPKEEVTLWKIASMMDSCRLMGADGKTMKDVAKEFVAYMEGYNFVLPRRFVVVPASVCELPKPVRFLGLPVKRPASDTNPWRDVTDNYSDRVIRFYIALYEKRNAQLGLLRRIANSFTKEEYREHKDSFRRLKADIRNGHYLFKESERRFFCDGWDDSVEGWDIQPRMAWIDDMVMRERLNCGRGKNEGDSRDPQINYNSVISGDLEANAKQLFKMFDFSRVGSPELLSLIGQLLAAMTYCSSYSRREVLYSLSYNDLGLQDFRCFNLDAWINGAFLFRWVVSFFRSSRLRVEVDSKGHVTTAAEASNLDKEEVKTVTVESRDGKTVYVIHNLNIYLTAEVVHQLNLNPQEVINHFHEQIEETVAKANKQNRTDT